MNAEPGPGRRREAGFTLLETLVAFAVLALVLGAAMPIFATGLRTLDGMAGYQRAVGLAEALLEEGGLDESLRQRTDAGATPDGFRWQRTVETASWWTGTSAAGMARPLEVHVEVSWSARGAERRVELSSVRAARSGP
jgi:general secretion pathway protein I